MNVYVLPFWILLPCVVASAFIWGTRPERSAAVLYAVAAIASFLPATHVGRSWMQVEAWILMVDVALLVALCSLVMRYRRWWIILAASFQTISTLAHLARFLDPGFNRTAYSLMEGISSYPSILLLGMAIWRSYARSSAEGVWGRRRTPPADCWRNSGG